MSRYVKADMIGCPCGYCEGYDECQKEVDEAPSIDIVRCKECTHWDRAIDENGIERFNFSKCVKGHYGNGFDFYCADGEREGE